MGSNNGDKDGFENVFRLVGGNGRFQWCYLVVCSIQLLMMTWNHMSYIFIGAVPQHWCYIPELEASSWSVEQIKNISIPKVYSSDGNDWKYEKCQHYNIDYKLLLEKSNGDFQRAYELAQNYHTANVGGDTDVSSSLEMPPPPLEDVPPTLKSCDAWSYDKSTYESTIVTEFDLVCGRRYLVASIQAFYMIGAFTGTLIFGPLNDRFLGRRNTTLISIVFVIVGGFLATFSTSYIMFIASRFLVAIGTAGCMQASGIWFLEHCDTKTRAKMYCINGAFFGVGYALMPIYAYYIRTWSNLQLSFTLTTLSLLSFFWILPESPRWLASHGRDEEAVRALEKIAKFNKMDPQPTRAHLLKYVRQCHLRDRSGANENNDGNEVDDQNDMECKQRMMLSSNSGGNEESFENRKWSRVVRTEGNNCIGRITATVKNFSALVSTPELRRISFVVWILFMAVAFVYYGFAFSSSTLTTNPYLVVSLGALMEVPASVLPIPFLSMWGRRPTLVACYLFTGVAALSISMTPAPYEGARTLFSMIGKLFVASAFTVLYLVVSEVYPTVVRSTGQGAGTLMGRVGSIGAPYMADMLTTVYPDLPSIIIGIVALVTAFIAMLLPEMKDVDMKDQVYEFQEQHEKDGRHKSGKCPDTENAAET